MLLIVGFPYELGRLNPLHWVLELARQRYELNHAHGYGGHRTCITELQALLVVGIL